MPLYTFKCRTCDFESEEMRNIGDFKEPLCPTCCYNPDKQDKQERMKRILSNIGKPRFKGNGFYETDYKNKPN